MAMSGPFEDMDAANGPIVVRLGHRPGRDDRMTTHVGLTARALGADRFVLVGSDGSPLDQIDDVTDRFGGPFHTERVDTFGAVTDAYSGPIAHLTMYGVPLGETIAEVEQTVASASVQPVIVVGAGKVPFDIYERATWNVAVTNQPHSEIAALAVFLDRLLDTGTDPGAFTGGTHRVVPQTTGKQLEPVTEVEDDS